MPQLDLLPSASSPFLTLLSWLLTYTLHSTLLGAGAWLVTGLIRGHALRATLWKAALLGGLLTTGMQMGLQVQPWGGRLALPAAWASPHNDDGRESFPAAMVLPGSTPAPAAEKTPASGVHTPPPAQSASAPANSLQQPSRATQGIAPLQALSWGHLLVAAWLTGAAFFLVRLLAAHRRFLHGLGTRTPVKDASLRDALQRLRRRSGHPRPVRLTQSDHLTSPVALGRNEICLPSRALVELNRAQQETMLAHELAHLNRRDPLWLMFSGLIRSLFFFQPLHRVGCRQLQESAEFLCDEWAVRHTGRHMTLARSLAQVATWLEKRPQPAILTPMAQLGSPLLRRIQHLVEGRPLARSPRWPRLAAAVLPVLLVVSLVPAVDAEGTQRGKADAPPAPTAPTPDRARTAPDAPTAPAMPAGGMPAPALAPQAPEAVVLLHEPAPPRAVLAPAAPASATAGPTYKGRAQWSREDEDRTFAMKIEGEVRFTPAMDAITSMAPGTRVRIDETADDRELLLTITADDNGLPLYVFTVDGRETPFEPEGRQFMQRALRDMNRHHTQARLRRQAAEEQRQAALAHRQARRSELLALQEHERQQSRDMMRAREEIRREQALAERAMREEQRQREMAYREAERDYARALRQEAQAARSEMQSQRSAARRQSALLYEEAERALRRAEQSEGESQQDALREARQLLEEARQASEALAGELATREAELQSAQEQQRHDMQQELQQMQQEMQEEVHRARQERQQQLEERQRQWELQQQEMLEQRRRLRQEWEQQAPPAPGPSPAPRPPAAAPSTPADEPH